MTISQLNKNIYCVHCGEMVSDTLTVIHPHGPAGRSKKATRSDSGEIISNVVSMDQVLSSYSTPTLETSCLGPKSVYVSNREKTQRQKGDRGDYRMTDGGKETFLSLFLGATQKNEYIVTAKGNFSLIYTGMYTLHDTAAKYWHDTVHYRENKQNICCSVGTACDLGIVFDPPIRHCHCQSGTCLSVSLPYWQLIWNPFIRRALQWQLSITDTDNRQLKRHRSSEWSRYEELEPL